MTTGDCRDGMQKTDGGKELVMTCGITADITFCLNTVF